MGTVEKIQAAGLRLTMSQRALDDLNLVDPREGPSTIWEHWEKNKDPNTRDVLNMPDDFRELLDEYMDASERSDGQKACEEFFQCPYSIKESVKRNFSGNSL